MLSWRCYKVIVDTLQKIYGLMVEATEEWTKAAIGAGA